MTEYVAVRDGLPSRYPASREEAMALARQGYYISVRTECPAHGFECSHAQWVGWSRDAYPGGQPGVSAA